MKPVTTKGVSSLKTEDCETLFSLGLPFPFVDPHIASSLWKYVEDMLFVISFYLQFFSLRFEFHLLKLFINIG
jgi:hypothetical protein